MFFENEISLIFSSKLAPTGAHSYLRTQGGHNGGLRSRNRDSNIRVVGTDLFTGVQQVGKESAKWFHVGTIIAIVVVLIVKAIKDRKWRFFS